ncbi:hypothetical protein [Frigoribacterium faeni]|jgi:hypothetical protein|nr:hypothetical protein [Frigoribacterium faeni]NIJ04599.1 hypothetical protein [Frigoribacterium faeni]
MTYPDPDQGDLPSLGDTDRRVTLLVVVASALAVLGTATAGLLTVLGLL